MRSQPHGHEPMSAAPAGDSNTTKTQSTLGRQDGLPHNSGEYPVLVKEKQPGHLDRPPRPAPCKSPSLPVKAGPTRRMQAPWDPVLLSSCLSRHTEQRVLVVPQAQQVRGCLRTLMTSQPPFPSCRRPQVLSQHRLQESLPPTLPSSLSKHVSSEIPRHALV